MTIPVQPVTADDLLHMPDDGWRYELVRGVLRKMTPAGGKHGRTAMNLSTPLDVHVREHNLGAVYAAETGFVLASDPDTVRAPDVSFVRRERIEEVGDVESFIPGAPDLAAEVVSPGDSDKELAEKVADWLAAGTRMVIVINPRRRTTTVHRSLTAIRLLTEADQLDGADVVPGWTLPVRQLFV